MIDMGVYRFLIFLSIAVIVRGYNMEMDRHSIGRSSDQIPNRIVLNLGDPKPLCECVQPVVEVNRTDYEELEDVGWFKIHKEPKSWEDARKICLSEGAHLAVPRTEREWKWIENKRTKEKAPQAWIGVHDQFSEGDWTTVFDENINGTTYLDWKKNEPNNDKGIEDCGILNKQLNDLDCKRKNAFVCKISAPQPCKKSCSFNY